MKWSRIRFLDCNRMQLHLAKTLAAKHGMAEALHAVLVTEGELRMQTRDFLTTALTTLLDAGITQKTIRADIDPNDVLMALGGVTLIAGDAGQRELAGRLLDLLMDGLAPRIE